MAYVCLYNVMEIKNKSSFGQLVLFPQIALILQINALN